MGGSVDIAQGQYLQDFGKHNAQTSLAPLPGRSGRDILIYLK